MASPAENKKIIEEFYAAFFAGDFEAGLKNWAPELTIVEVDSLPYAGSYRGREQWLDLFNRLMTTWTDLALTVDDLLVSDTRVAAYGTFTAKSTKTGKPVKFPMVEVWELKDGKIVGCAPVYGDTHMVVEALS
jgi:ketosteroid isomerase-like protein